MDHSISRTSPVSAPETEDKAALRERLLAARTAAGQRDPAVLATLAARVAALLPRLPVEHTQIIGFYWPMRAEPDLRDTIVNWLATDMAADNAADTPINTHLKRIVALPVVTDPRQAMVFHRWTPSTPMHAGKFGIPVPVDPDIVHPTLLLVPCVGFDRQCYRLGYGGGFYDRTLAALTPRPLTIGIALNDTRCEALPVEAHDLPLDGILTECDSLGLAQRLLT